MAGCVRQLAAYHRRPEELLGHPAPDQPASRRFTVNVFPILSVAFLGMVTPREAPDPVATFPVQFANGTSSKSMKGTVRGYATANYMVSARAGQTMTVRLTTSNRSSYFNVIAPGADAAMFIGSMAGDLFSATVPSTGIYTVRVYLMSNAARRSESAKYTVEVAVR